MAEYFQDIRNFGIKLHAVVVNKSLETDARIKKIKELKEEWRNVAFKLIRFLGDAYGAYNIIRERTGDSFKIHEIYNIMLVDTDSLLGLLLEVPVRSEEELATSEGANT